MADGSSPIAAEFISDVKAALGEKGWSEDPNEIDPHLQDWRGNYKGYSGLLLKPANTEEISEVLKLFIISIHSSDNRIIWIVSIF